MANEIVWFDSSETGAPTLNNAAGSLDSILHACLVTGFRNQALTSLVVAGGVATGTLAGHGYGNLRMVDIDGATPSALNGRKLVTAAGSGAFTFPAPGVPDGPATGAITAKRSPLGWTRPLSSGNVSMYQRTDVLATAMRLRVDDSGSGAASAIAARWRMVNSYTDLNTFTNPAPAAEFFGGAGVYLPKGFNTVAAKPWVLVGDSRTFYLFTEASSYSTNGPQGIFGFGDIEPYRAGDPFACLLAGADTANSNTPQSLGQRRVLRTNPGSPAVVFAAPFNGFGPPVSAAILGHEANTRVGSTGPLYPSPVDNGMVISSPVMVMENNAVFSYPIRGQLRGLGDPLANIPARLLHLQVLEDVVGSDRRWLIVGFDQEGSNGHVAIDITGPW